MISTSHAVDVVARGEATKATELQVGTKPHGFMELTVTRRKMRGKSKFNQSGPGGKYPQGSWLAAIIILVIGGLPLLSLAGPNKRYVHSAPARTEARDEVHILTPVPPVPNNSMGGMTLDALEAEFLQNRSLVHVKGRVTNISNSYIRGFLTLNILSAAGINLFSSDMPLNNHQPIANGESISFDTTINVSAIKGASKVSLDFTRD